MHLSLSLSLVLFAFSFNLCCICHANLGSQNVQTEEHEALMRVDGTESLNLSKLDGPRRQGCHGLPGPCHVNNECTRCDLSAPFVEQSIDSPSPQLEDPENPAWHLPILFGELCLIDLIRSLSGKMPNEFCLPRTLNLDASTQGLLAHILRFGG